MKQSETKPLKVGERFTFAGGVFGSWSGFTYEVVKVVDGKATLRIVEPTE